MKYISLFSSAGIGTFGLKENGFDCIATNEFLKERLDIQKFNNISKDADAYILGDIKKEETKNKIYNQIKKHKGVDIIISTPPCQGISLLNLKKTEDDKFRNSLVVESLEIIKKSKPKLFVIENVQRFLQTACFYNESWISIKDAIKQELGDDYSIAYKTLNLKHIGSKSSRTRTIVVGVNKKISKHFSPWELFPSRVKKIPTLKQTLKGLSELEWGEIDKKDFYHSYRVFDIRMLPWIENLEPNMSAFDNVELRRKPHQIIDGNIILNKNSTGDKYKRQDPDQVAKCVMTRNDQLASQNTIHPYENRVLSIRELMNVMTIPRSFRFVDHSIKELNLLEESKKRVLYKKHELNIRRTIGEAVPTFLFKKITKRFEDFNNRIFLNSNSEAKKFILENKINNNKELMNWAEKLTRYSLNLCFEILAYDSKEKGMYFTHADIVTDLINDINFKGGKILEPSVGIGSMIIPLIKSMPDKDIQLSVFDINPDAIEIFQKISEDLNIEIEATCGDFLLRNKESFDFTFGNPPYVSLSPELKKKYNATAERKNLFELFTIKASSISKEVIFVLPKYVLFNNKYGQFRNHMLTHGVKQFWDYRGMFFPNAKIETIAIKWNNKNNKIFISDNEEFSSNLLTNKRSTIWVIHPDMEILKWEKNLHFYNDTESKRLLSINNGSIKTNGKIKVWTSKNTRKIKAPFMYTESDTKGHDSSLEGIFVPNMTPNIRAMIKPKNVLWNGSLALVMGKVTKDHNAIKTWNSDEFRSYINMLRSHAERSINIDKEIIKHFGVIND